MKASMCSPDTFNIVVLLSLSRHQETLMKQPLRKQTKNADKEVQMRLVDSDISDLISQRQMHY